MSALLAARSGFVRRGTVLGRDGKQKVNGAAKIKAGQQSQGLVSPLFDRHGNAEAGGLDGFFVFGRLIARSWCETVAGIESVVAVEPQGEFRRWYGVGRRVLNVSVRDRSGRPQRRHVGWHRGERQVFCQHNARWP